LGLDTCDDKEGGKGGASQPAGGFKTIHCVDHSMISVEHGLESNRAALPTVGTAAERARGRRGIVAAR
jgi:hypothetical protein